MDPRLEVPSTAGEKIKIHLLSGYVWEVPRPPISPIDPYLYPDRPGRRYNNEDPIFHLGSEDYYFALDEYSRLMVVFMSDGTIELPNQPPSPYQPPYPPDQPPYPPDQPPYPPNQPLPDVGSHPSGQIPWSNLSLILVVPYVLMVIAGYNTP